jgi:hypothetical protein
VRIVEITYQYGGSDAAVRARPPDADAAPRHSTRKLSDSALLDSPLEDRETARRIIPIDRDLGLSRATRVPEQRPYAAVLAAPMRVCRSS